MKVLRDVRFNVQANGPQNLLKKKKKKKEKSR